jgi:hypothetical protein
MLYYPLCSYGTSCYIFRFAKVRQLRNMTKFIVLTYHRASMGEPWRRHGGNMDGGSVWLKSE